MGVSHLRALAGKAGEGQEGGPLGYYVPASSHPYKHHFPRRYPLGILRLLLYLTYNEDKPHEWQKENDGLTSRSNQLRRAELHGIWRSGREARRVHKETEHERRYQSGRSRSPWEAAPEFWPPPTDEDVITSTSIGESPQGVSSRAWRKAG